MEEKLLYPIKFCTLQDDYCWGSEVLRSRISDTVILL